MAITVNTNIPSLIAQQNLNRATKDMNTAMERMSTGLKINSSIDDAAGMAVANNLDYKVSSFNVAQSNAQMGSSLLTTAEGVLKVINSNLVRIRDLTEQAANGTYGSDATNAIAIEVSARFEEITRTAKTAEFNGIMLLDGSRLDDINLQVGIKNDNDSVIKLDKDLFAAATATELFPGKDLSLSELTEVYKKDTDARSFLDDIDTAIKNITNRTTSFGGKQQALASAREANQIMATNLTSASSLIKDADMAVESSNYIRNQILQQTTATLLSTANQAPSIATNLV